MIEANQLTKRFGDVTAISDVTFRVERGEILAFLGPNGAGKTTTMRILTAFLPASSGTARIAGFDTFEAPMEVKRRIGYLPETPPLYPELTVDEYLRFVARVKGIPRREQTAALQRVLEQCGLTEVRRRLIANLSRGYRQRTGLAQALIHNPDVLILDEPTVGLDPKQIIEIRQVIKGLTGQHTVILSTHILPEATAVCQRVIIIHEGRIVAVDTPERLSAQIRQSEKIQISVRRPVPELEDGIRSIPGVLHLFTDDGGAGRYVVEAQLGRDIREELARYIVVKDFGLLELRPVALTLEDVFLKLTQEDRPGGMNE